MQLKPYQKSALKLLGDFLGKAQEVDPAQAFDWALDQPPLEDQPPLRQRLGRFAGRYRAPHGLGDTPYCCIRLPTGGGKTILAAHAVPLARDGGVSREYPILLWLVTSNVIRKQTVEALADPRHPYRATLDAAFGGAVRVFDIGDFANITPHDLASNACIVVGTVQTLRVENTEGRKVYQHHEALEPFFSRLDAATLAAFPGLEKTEAGGVRYSFANLLHMARPMMIVDEAHNVVTTLSDQMRERINPWAVVEFTATPRGRSNILFNATAAELKAEQMIKMPIVLQEHAHWQSAVAGAVAERARLADLATKEKEPLRPITLYQAEPKDREVTVEVLRRHLIDDLSIPEERIAVATGDQRGLDGVDLSAPGCPIEHIITVEALKEGWDCPFAYVFCSVASIKSSVSVEQLLGRVLRMPYATRRRAPELNRAYAHVSEPTFYAAATALKDALVDMGFEDGEAEQAIEHPQLDLSDGLFAPPKPPATLDLIDTPETRAVLAEHGVAVIETRPGVLTLVAAEVARPGLIEQVMEASPASAAELKRAVEALPVAPATRGAVMRVPALGTTINGELMLADLDLLMEHVEWRLSEQSPAVPGLAESLGETVRRYLIDVDGRQVTHTYLTGDLFEGAEQVDGWNEARLVALLDPLVRDPSFTQSDKVGWLQKVVSRLIQIDGLSLAQLMRMRQALARKLTARIDDLRRQHRATTARKYLLEPGAPVQALANEAFEFRYGMYDDQPAYRGPIGFTKHFLDRVPAFDGKADGEEARCAQALDSLKQVKHWARNVAKHPASFWLQTSTQRTYPDFVAELIDGRFFVVEYKGADHWADAAEDRAIGEVWARATGNLYLMARVRDDDARDVVSQLTRVLSKA